MRVLPWLLLAAATAFAHAGDGDIDAGFADHGYLVQAPADASLRPYAITTQPDGKLVLAGTRLVLIAPDDAQVQAAVWRFLADGTPDPVFGMGGLASLLPAPLGSASRSLLAITMTDGGRLLAVGGIDGPAVLRLEADGSLDAGFGNAGIAMLDCPALATSGPAIFGAITRDAAGRILLAGSAPRDVDGVTVRVAVVSRRLADGAADPGFGTAGCAALTLDGDARADLWLSSIAVDRQGRIVVAGRVDGSVPQGVLVARLQADGTRDDGFGDQGLAIGSPAGASDIRGAGAIQRHGRWLVAGIHDWTTTAARAFVWALDDAGQVDASWGDQGWAFAVLGSPAYPRPAFACQDDDRCLLLDSELGPAATRRYVVTRLTRDGLPDPTFGTAGQSRLAVPTSGDGSHIVARALTLQAGRAVLAGTTDGVPYVEALLLTRLQADLIFADGAD